MKKLLPILAVVLGILFIVLAFVYWTTPANNLPSYLPGHDLAKTTPHFKHGLGSLVVGLALLAFAWFRTGKRSAKQEQAQ